jgi:hypothetical protein
VITLPYSWAWRLDSSYPGMAETLRCA